MELSLLNGKNSFAPTLHWDILIFSLIGLRTGQHDQNNVPARLSDNIWGSSPFVYFRHQNRVQQICIFMKVTTQQSHSEDSRMQRWGSRPGFNYFAVEFSFSTIHKTISVVVHILKWVQHYQPLWVKTGSLTPLDDYYVLLCVSLTCSEQGSVPLPFRNLLHDTMYKILFWMGLRSTQHNASWRS